MKSKSAVFSVISAGSLWGLTSLFIKNMSRLGLDSMQIATLRLIVAAVIFGTFVLIKDKSLLKIKLRDIWMFVGTGIVSVVLFNCTYFYTVVNTDASIAVVLLYTSPIFIMILSLVLFKEKINLRKIIAVILTFLGCIFVVNLVGGSYTIKPFIILTGILSGFFYALYTIFGRYALAKYDTMTVTAYTFILGMLASLPIGKLPSIFHIIAENPMLILYALCNGIISTVLPYFLYTWGLQRMESGKAAILVAVEPIVGALVGIIFFKEACTFQKVFGILMIIGAIIILNIEPKKKLKNN